MASLAIRSQVDARAGCIGARGLGQLQGVTDEPRLSVEGEGVGMQREVAMGEGPIVSAPAARHEPAAVAAIGADVTGP